MRQSFQEERELMAGNQGAHLLGRSLPVQPLAVPSVNTRCTLLLPSVPNLLKVTESLSGREDSGLSGGRVASGSLLPAPMGGCQELRACL